MTGKGIAVGSSGCNTSHSGGSGGGGQRLVTSMDSGVAFQLRRFLEFLFANNALVVIVLAVLIHSVSFPYEGIPRGGVAAERVKCER